MDKTRETLQQIFRETFDDETLVLRDDMSSGDVANWDSLAHINMIIAVEAAFKIKFAVAEISAMKKPGQTVADFLRLLESKLSGPARGT
jgi:acyl carrier protein